VLAPAGTKKNTMRAVFLDFDTFGPCDLDTAPLTRLLPDIELCDNTPAELLAARLERAGIAIVNKIVLDRATLELAPHLKLVCLAATGTNNIDLEAARARGIAVTNIRNYCTSSVTQHVFALVLALTQRLREYEALLDAGAWQRSNRFCLLDHPFRELSGRTFGIVGLGNLGASVAHIAGAFGMQVLAAQRPYRDSGGQSDMAQHPSVQRVAFRELLGRSDIVSLHCPLTPETHHLIDAEAFGGMRRDALLINTARGALVDTAALLQAVRGGLIAGAGIDVLEREPPPDGHPLLAARLPNLIVTPHMAWAAREARQRALGEIAANITAFAAGERRNRVD
jgi:glycerate dehydrogenase